MIFERKNYKVIDEIKIFNFHLLPFSDILVLKYNIFFTENKMKLALEADERNVRNTICIRDDVCEGRKKHLEMISSYKRNVSYVSKNKCY